MTHHYLSALVNAGVDSREAQAMIDEYISLTNKVKQLEAQRLEILEEMRRLWATRGTQRREVTQ